ncbi:hypothetical protein PFISCL1PPCAC_1251, partial [Pristionchus fissidentatus]
GDARIHKNTMHERRNDIQGLRAWAVIAVVLFHFFPVILPVGYLGVDVFFVLSGFLISLVLNNKPPLVVSTYTNFYFKRIRRIFPLLLSTVLICSVYSVMNYSRTLFLYSERGAQYAALFMTNLKGVDEGEDYFRDLQKVEDLLTHTWSLSVEIQFYLLAPFALHLFKPFKSFSTIGYLLIIMVSSFVYFHSLSSSVSFYSTSARFWQFTAGSIAFHLQKEPGKHEELPSFVLSIGLFGRSKKGIIARLRLLPVGIATALIFWSSIFNNLEYTLRIVVTCITATLLVVKLNTPVLTNAILQMIGDSSYALYLIHWPVVCILKYYEYNSWPEKSVAVVLCFLAAFLILNYYEKWYLTLNEKSTLILIGCLYLACTSVYVIYALNEKEPPQMGSLDRRISIEEAKRINQYMDDYLEENLRFENCTLRDPSDQNPWGFCNLPPGDGSLSFLIIGNSYAANHGRMVVKHLKKHYGKIAVYTVSECEPLVETKNPYCYKAGQLQEGFLKDIETLEPEVLFISASFGR